MKDGTRKILAKARRALGAARELSSQGAVDMAAGRAYYAMVYAAKALLYERGVRLQSHAGIVDALERQTASSHLPASHADWLREAIARRVADRDTDLVPTSADADSLIERATEIVLAATDLLERPP